MNRLLTFLERYLDPGEQLGQALFGLVMVLTFTLAGVALVSDAEEPTRDLLLGVLGCNVAWGIIQGWMYVIDCVFERSRNARLVLLVQEAADAEQALALVRAELDPRLEEATSEAARAALYQDIYRKAKDAGPPKNRATWHDLYGAIVVFVLVVATTIPALLPFLLIDDLRVALRVSNVLLVLMLFWVGYRWAALTSTNRWRAGLQIMLGGVAMVGIAEVLGG